MKCILLLSMFLSLLSVNCKKSSPLSELDKLPPATQEGKNTFGCLINGKAWIPQGYRFSKPNFFIIVDPTFNGGDVDIRTYRVTNIDESLSIAGFPIKGVGITMINDSSTTRVNFASFTMAGTPLYQFYQDATMYRKGFLKVTKYDFINGIVAGEFEVTIFKPNSGGDTLRITNGRFDKKL